MPEPSKAALVFPLQMPLAPLLLHRGRAQRGFGWVFVGGSGLNCVARALNPNSAPETTREAFSPGSFYTKRYTFRSPARCWGFVSILAHCLGPNNQNRQFWKEKLLFNYFFFFSPNSFTSPFETIFHLLHFNLKHRSIYFKWKEVPT